MRYAMILLVSGMLFTGLLAGCGDDNSTGPSTGGGNGGGGTTPPPEGSPAPGTASVTVGDIFFKSDRNGTTNPAVDTVAVNGIVTWTWASSVTMAHSVVNHRTPSFSSSAIMAGPGTTHQATFGQPGTYLYDCAVHGQLMTGMIVVVDTTGAALPPDSSAAMPSVPVEY